MAHKLVVIVLAVLTAIAVTPTDVFGWGASRSFSGAGRFGGSFSHSASTSGGWGGFSHSGSSSYTSPSGETFSGSRSGTGTYGYGGVNYSGSYSTANHGSGSYSGSYYGYHGPSYTTVNTGCYGSGFGAGVVTGAVVGATVGAAVAANSTPVVVAPTYVYPNSGVYVAPPAPVEVAPPPVAQGMLPLGTAMTVLPAGFVSLNVNGVQYYQSGPNWFQMRFGSDGSSGVYFVVVRAP